MHRGGCTRAGGKHAMTSRAAAVTVWRQPRGVATALVVIALLFLFLSPSALLHLGWQYGDTGGSVVEKFHPATWALGLVFAVVLMSCGNPLTKLHEILHVHPLLIIYLGGIGFMTWYAARVIGVPYTLFIETFLPAFFLFVLLYDLPERLGRTLALVIHAALFANAVLGILELTLDFRLTPLIANGEIIVNEPRATAFLGHPLSNAMIMGTYLLTFALGGGRDLPPLLRPVVFLVCAASLAAFGGRAATALLLIFLLFVVAQRLVSVGRGSTFNTRSLAAGIFVVPVVGVIALGLYELGFFGTFLDRVGDDTGSADTRIVMFDLFRHQSWHDLLLAPDPGVLATWARLYGTEYGIESFVVQYLLTYGIIATAVFLPALFVMSYEIARHVRPGATTVLVYFFAVSLTSVGLSAKSPAFTILVLMLLVLLRRTRGRGWRAGPAMVSRTQRRFLRVV